jgi:hypothetical protein
MPPKQMSETKVPWLLGLVCALLLGLFLLSS